MKMIQSIKSFIKSTPIYGPICDIRDSMEAKNWERKGKIGPPPHLVKQKAVKEYAKLFALDALIETGTYMGKMISACKKDFKEIFSIELDKKLAEKAKKKFSKYEKIHIFQGDSGKELVGIMTLIDKPCLFWLDAHYSGGVTAKGDIETPVAKELELIFNHSIKNHAILIDDAKNFIGKNDYPTLEWLRDYVLKNRPGWIFEAKDNIIRIHQK